MNHAEIRKLIPAVRVAINARHRKFSNPKGPEGRMMMLRKTVTELVKLERVELNYHRGDEARGYAERVRMLFLLQILGLAGFGVIASYGRVFWRPWLCEVPGTARGVCQAQPVDVILSLVTTVSKTWQR